SDIDDTDDFISYDARLFKSEESVVMITIEDFRKSTDSDTELDSALPKFWDNVEDIWSSIQLK
ncbi:MAG: hypothetical protein MK212_13960, partial [Saprospiraceae bacterium]|nr:hypothetical protein [Saprospiraceae bacterium]